MPDLDTCFLRIDRTNPGADALHLTVEWPCLPREGELLDIAEDIDPQTVESVGYDVDGHPTVYV